MNTSSNAALEPDVTTLLGVLVTGNLLMVAFWVVRILQWRRIL